MRAAAVLLGALAGPAGALTLDLPAGATLAFEAAEEPGRHLVATGPWAEGALPVEAAEGPVSRQVWQVPGTAPTLALLAALRAQAEAQGLTVLLDCDQRTCGGFDFRAAVEVLPPPAMFVDLGDYRYLAARGEGVALSLLVSRSDALGFVQVIEVGDAASRSAGGAPPPEGPAAPAIIPPAPEGAAPGTGPSDASPDAPAEAPADPAAPAGSLGARLEAEGRVVIDGLAFASGSAAVSGGEAALDALAEWLAADPARRVAIVGHTDATGPLDANVALSRRRAEAVAAALLDRPGVARAQVEAGGMGYLAPRATNLTPEGREANRRVEAVVLPPG